MRKPFVIVLALLAGFGAIPMAASAALAQDTTGATGGVSVIGIGEATAPAETATIQFAISEESFGPPLAPIPGTTPGAREREAVAPVVDALVNAGVPEDSIVVTVAPYVGEVYGPFGPAIALFSVELTDPDPERIVDLVDAATIAAADDRRAVTAINVSYALEDCAALERAAREAAIADARHKAEDQAALLDATVGELLASRDVPFLDASGYQPYGLVSLNSCSPIDTPRALPGLTGLSTFDPNAPAEVTVYARVELTFALLPGTGATPAG